MAEKNIDAILQRLIRILSQEIVTYTKLLTALEEKQQAIIEGKVSEMQFVVDKEQSILADAKLTENERNMAISTLRANFKDLKKVENLSQLIAAVEIKYHSRLTNHSIHFVQTMIKDLLSSNENINDLYSQDGKRIDPKYLALLDRRG